MTGKAITAVHGTEVIGHTIALETRSCAPGTDDHSANRIDALGKAGTRWCRRACGGLKCCPKPWQRRPRRAAADLDDLVETMEVTDGDISQVDVDQNLGAGHRHSEHPLSVERHLPGTHGDGGERA